MNDARRKKLNVRPWVRAVHRDLGYLAVGLTFVYALSGIAVNHLAEWDPNMTREERMHEIGGPIQGTDDEMTVQILSRLGIQEAPKESYRTAEDELTILFERRTLTVSTAEGHVVDRVERPRFFLKVANWLHLNRGKKAWTYFADAYAAGLLLLALSGIFMIPGKKGLIGRGAVLVTLGAAIPLAYVLLSPK